MYDQSTSSNHDTEVIDKTICDHLECSNYSTIKLELDAGKFGTVLLNLCPECVNLFKKDYGNA